MIEHYLSSNNEMYYSTKINNFSPTVYRALSQRPPDEQLQTHPRISNIRRWGRNFFFERCIGFQAPTTTTPAHHGQSSPRGALASADGRGSSESEEAVLFCLLGELRRWVSRGRGPWVC